MTKTPEQAIAAARHQSAKGPRFGVGLCLQRVRLCYDVAAKYPDASAAWSGARRKHPTRRPAEIPRGVPVWWTGGRRGHGHVAISTGDGKCWSTDIARPGYFDLVEISLIEKQWGVRLEGWSEDLNGVTVWTPPTRTTRGVRVDKAIALLEHAKGGSQRQAAFNSALRALKALPTLKVTR